jgi:hypothetical protein
MINSKEEKMLLEFWNIKFDKINKLIK